jgi:hypothetical protein
MKKIIVLIITSISLLTCDDIIEVEDISNKSITILAPKSGVNVEDVNVSFTWEALEDIDNYKIQIAKPNFETAQQIVTDSLVSITSFNKSLTSGSYEWRVRAENSGYVTSFTTQNFTVATDVVDISNETVVISSPSNDSRFLTTDTITFSWESLEGATGYNIELVTPDFDDPTETIKDDITTETTFSVSNLEVNTYMFRIYAENSGFETGFTEIEFTVI